jgi:DNA-binding transcriptional ArsR family regulator
MRRLTIDWLNQSISNRLIRMKLLLTLFPRVRAEVLRLLFFNPKKERYVRELVGHSGLALRTVQEELAKLSAAGLVTSRKHGKRRYYQANCAHPAFSHLQQLVITGLTFRSIQAKTRGSSR